MPIVDNNEYASELNETIVTYKSNNKKIEYQYISKKNGVKENIILKEKPKLNELYFDIDMKNMIWKYNKSSEYITFFDAELVLCQDLVQIKMRYSAC